MMLPLDLWSGRQLNIIAQANRLRRLHDGYKLPDYQRNLVVVLIFNAGEIEQYETYNHCNKINVFTAHLMSLFKCLRQQI